MNRILVLLFFCASASYLVAQDYAREQLENSPRHHEWISVKANGREVRCFVAYPEKSENTTVVVVIHENRGLNDWARSFADQIAAAGYLAVAPDLLSGFSEEHSSTSSFSTSDETRDAIYQLDPEQVITDLKAVVEYAGEAPSSNGKVVVAGFCWGGSQSFKLATRDENIEAALVFYGSSPDDTESLKNINVPVYGFYGENDQRINQQIPATEEKMEKLGKTYDYVIYEGAGHAYMRRGDDPEVSDANTVARDQSWERLKNILAGI